MGGQLSPHATTLEPPLLSCSFLIQSYMHSKLGVSILYMVKSILHFNKVAKTNLTDFTRETRINLFLIDNNILADKCYYYIYFTVRCIYKPWPSLPDIHICEPAMHLWIDFNE